MREKEGIVKEIVREGKNEAPSSVSLPPDPSPSGGKPFFQRLRKERGVDHFTVTVRGL